MQANKEDYENIKDKLFLRLCNAEQNQATLQSVPHARQLDLAITYHILLGKSPTHHISLMITLDMLDKWKIDASRLHRDAMENSLIKMPCIIRPIQEILSHQGETTPGSSSTPLPLYVIKGEAEGSAAGLFYPGTQSRLAEIAGGDYFILPSSIHEVLMLPCRELEAVEQLKSMVKEINHNLLDAKDRLSNNVYRYMRESKKLVII